MWIQSPGPPKQSEFPPPPPYKSKTLSTDLKMPLVQRHHCPWFNIINSAFQQKKLDQTALQFWGRNKISSHCVQTKPGAAGQIWEVHNTSQVGVEESTLITKQWISTPQPATITHGRVSQGVKWSGRIHAVPSLFIRQAWWLILIVNLTGFWST